MNFFVIKLSILFILVTVRFIFVFIFYFNSSFLLRYFLDIPPLPKQIHPFIEIIQNQCPFYFTSVFPYMRLMMLDDANIYSKSAVTSTQQQSHNSQKRILISP